MRQIRQGEKDLITRRFLLGGPSLATAAIASVPLSLSIPFVFPEHLLRVPMPPQLARPGLIDDVGQGGCPGAPWNGPPPGGVRDEIDDLLDVESRAAPGSLEYLVTVCLAALLRAGTDSVDTAGPADQDPSRMAAEPGGAVVSQNVSGVGGVEHP